MLQLAWVYWHYPGRLKGYDLIYVVAYGFISYGIILAITYLRKKFQTRKTGRRSN